MIFTGKKILAELKALRYEIAITTAVIKALAKYNGYKIEVTRSEKNGAAMVALVKEGDDHVQFHPIPKE